MKNFLAGVIVTSSLSLLGFLAAAPPTANDTRAASPEYIYRSVDIDYDAMLAIGINAKAGHVALTDKLKAEAAGVGGGWLILWSFQPAPWTGEVWCGDSCGKSRSRRPFGHRLPKWDSIQREHKTTPSCSSIHRSDETHLDFNPAKKNIQTQLSYTGSSSNCTNN